MRWENKPPPLPVQPLAALADALVASGWTGEGLAGDPHGYCLSKGVPEEPLADSFSGQVPEGAREQGLRGRLHEAGLTVWVPAAVEASVLAHLGAAPDEQGGLLVGELFGDLANGGAGVTAVLLGAAVPALEHAASAVALRMESRVWTAARARLGSQGAIVGWYHSHPGLTAFFSGTDRATQRAFFNHPYSLGWVIDPLLGGEAWFRGAGSEAVAVGAIRRPPQPSAE